VVSDISKDRLAFFCKGNAGAKYFEMSGTTHPVAEELRVQQHCHANLRSSRMWSSFLIEMLCTVFDISHVNISVLHLIVLILSHFQEVSKKVRTEEQTATKEILQRIFPDIRIEDNKVKYDYFVFFITLSLVLRGSDTWPVTFGEEYKLKVLECRVLMKDIEHKRKAVTGNW
jgi:hypothetical protein